MLMTAAVALMTAAQVGYAALPGMGGAGAPTPSLPSAPSAKPAVPGGSSAASPRDRGAYLAGILGCAGCHTPWGDDGMDQAKLYGGIPPHEPGKSGNPNISPDQETGIGTWTDAQIAAAIRDGLRPNGSRLAPGMPSRAYHGMTDADVNALVVFLRSVKPVANKIDRIAADPADVAKWPVIPTTSGFVDPAEPAGHGGYLAGLLKCEGCHTPPDGSPAAGKRFAGGKEFKGRGPDAKLLYASNLTPDDETGIGKWTIEQIAASVTELVRPDGSKIQGPMNFSGHNWEQLTDADANALGAFLKSLPPVRHKVGPTAGADQKGRKGNKGKQSAASKG